MGRRGNLQLQITIIRESIHIEYSGFTMLIRILPLPTTIQEIAPQAFPSVTTSRCALLAMTSWGSLYDKYQFEFQQRRDTYGKDPLVQR